MDLCWFQWIPRISMEFHGCIWVRNYVLFGSLSWPAPFPVHPSDDPCHRLLTSQSPPTPLGGVRLDNCNMQQCTVGSFKCPLRKFEERLMPPRFVVRFWKICLICCCCLYVFLYVCHKNDNFCRFSFLYFCCISAMYLFCIFSYFIYFVKSHYFDGVPTLTPEQTWALMLGANL